MKAIIIQDHDAKALLDRLKLSAFRTDSPSHERHLTESWQQLPVRDREQLVKELHGRFHYIVTVWLQEQGASTT